MQDSMHKSFKIMKIHVFETLDKASPNRENMTELNFAVVKHMIVKVNKFRCNRSYF
jgi:hypothetical protein